MVHPEIRLSTREKVQLLWLVPLVLFKTVVSSVFGVLTDKSAAIHPIRTVGVNLLRHVTLTLSFRQRLAGDVLSTGDAVAAFCASRKLAHSAVPVPVPAAGRGDRASTFHAPAIPDATLHLITVNSSPSNPAPSAASSPSASNRTILYLHGGGFAHPINSQGQIPLALRCAEALASSHPGSTTTLAILEYHLAPAHRYPTQLAQSLAALRTLVTGGAGLQPVPPEQIVLLGDSAGGNLLLGVLAALKAGRAPRGVGNEVVTSWRRPAEGVRPLAAAVAVCPWCGLGEYAGRGAGSSYERNARWDFLYVKEMEELEEAVGMGRARGVVWGDMVGAAKARKVEEENGDEDGELDGEGRGEWGAEFWSGVVRGEGRVVERMLVSVGTREVFLDDVVEFVGLMGAGQEDGEDDGKVVFVKGPNEVHVGAVVDVALGINDDEGSLPAILSFFKGL
ncbi:hypothetical protein DIS24_g3223 [Lasiodiplodia hormozganensis]|uniref:Alpha/beta hydrolase fold-3 domain-containing protein n=1 Tax=Lasiodiplodia hormozganensis TaxID=869390 RepID=A0AA39YY55_9PEZI|nr:hypothetical protein DIS24_g3223 [Lasiodiplodia hormozganensis]